MADPQHAQSLTAVEHKTNSRIEAFSDIVFGFSLFNLALNLKAPATPHELIAQIPQFAVFIGTFGVLCSIWWLHHRLFLEFFKPDNAGIVLNFFLLGAVAMFTYPLQLFMKFGTDNTITFAAYAVGGALVYGLCAALLIKGLVQLGPAHPPSRRAAGIMLATRLTIVALSMIAALTVSSQGAFVMALSITLGAIAAAIATRIQKKILKDARNVD